MCSHDRDNEYGSVYVNGEECWSKLIELSSGEHQCGGQGSKNNWREDHWRIECGTVSVNGEIIVLVNTTLNQLPSDESFAIDNVKVTRLGTYMHACMPTNMAHTNIGTRIRS